jgi:hypothetical protein
MFHRLAVDLHRAHGIHPHEAGAPGNTQGNRQWVGVIPGPGILITPLILYFGDFIKFNFFSPFLACPLNPPKGDL